MKDDNVNMSNNNVSVQFWYLHSWLEGLTLSQIAPWIVAHIKSNKVLNHTTIEKLINQLQHVYNDSELKKKVTCTLRALKQMRKPFARHLTTFEQTLLKAEGLKWDDAVKKTFLNNSLNTTLMWALIAIAIYDQVWGQRTKEELHIWDMVWVLRKQQIKLAMCLLYKLNNCSA